MDSAAFNNRLDDRLSFAEETGRSMGVGESVESTPEYLAAEAELEAEQQEAPRVRYSFEPPQEPGYEDEGLEFDPEDDGEFYDEPNPYDPEAIRDVIREELGSDEQVDLAEHAREWEALQAGQSASEMAADMAEAQEAYAALEATINQATHGQLAGMGEYAPAFAEAVGAQMLELAAEAGTDLLNAGHPSEEIGPALERNMNLIAEAAVRQVHDQQSIADMKAAARLHFRGAR
jgi:hypothetical protein